MRAAIILLIMLCLCVGCEKERFIDTGPILIDQDCLPQEVEINNENR
jgi:hypothetical protein